MAGLLRKVDLFLSIRRAGESVRLPILYRCCSTPRRTKGGLRMGIIAWIVLGLIAGWIASKIMHGEGSGLLMNLVLGVVGAFVGGLLISVVGGVGVTGFNLWSLLVSVLGAVIVLWLSNALRSRRRVS